MNTQKLKGIPCLVALVLVALVAATCTIPLRGGEEQAKIAEPGSMSPDPLAAKLAECRSVTYEQKDALTECRRLGRKNVASSSDRTLGPPPIVGCRKRGPLCL
jgi:conjugative transfer region protein TrbK